MCNYFCHVGRSKIIGAVRGPTLNYEEQLFMHVSHLLRGNMTKDLAHLLLSDLQGEIDLYAERLVYREKDGLYAKRNGYFSY